MSPEFGSTCAIFPIDAETLRYLEFTGRSEEQRALVETYAKEQGLWHDEDSEDPTFSDLLELDLGDVVPSLAGPRRPQDRVAAHRDPDRVPRGDPGVPARGRREHGDRKPGVPPARERGEDDDAESFPASDPPSSMEPSNGDGERDRRRVAAPREHDHSSIARAASARGRRSSSPTGPRPSSTTATSSSPRSRRARTPRTRRSCSARACSPRRRVEKGLETQAVGEDVARPGLDGRHRVLREARPRRAARGARLPPRRLRLHDVHRQLRPAARRDLRGRQRARPGRRLGALGQPQLRGPHQPRREDELPRVAAARRRLRARGDDGLGPAQRPVPGQRRLRSRTSGPPSRRSPRRSSRPSTRTCSRKSYAEVFEGDERWNSLDVPEGDRFEWDDDSTYVRQPAVLRGHARRARAGRGDHRRARARQARRLGHHRPHLAGRRDQEGLAGRASTSRSTASSRASSTPTARGAATTR